MGATAVLADITVQNGEPFRVGCGSKGFKFDPALGVDFGWDFHLHSALL